MLHRDHSGRDFEVIKKHRAGYAKGDAQIENILESAEHVLVENGYHSFSMRKVAGAAGISVGNLQYYFPSKESLLEAMLDGVIRDYLIMFDEIRHHGTPEEQFVAMISEIINDLKTKRTTRFFPELWSLANHDEKMNRHMDAMYGKYREVLMSVISEINPALTQKQVTRLGLFISSSIEGHTVFIGFHKPWMRETRHIVDIATQSFLYLIKEGDIPD